MNKSRQITNLLIKSFLIVLFISAISAQQKRTITFKDVMKFKQIKKQVISEDGNWVAYVANPDRGNGELILRSTENTTEYRIERGDNPLFSKDGKWLAAKQLPDFYKSETAKKDKPEPGLVLINNNSGITESFEKAKEFNFSADSKWLAVLFAAEKKEKDDKKFTGSKFIIKSLTADKIFETDFVDRFAFDSLSNYIACSVADTTAANNGLFLLDLNVDSFEKILIDTLTNGKYGNLNWNKSGSLAFTRTIHTEKSKADSAGLFIWNKNLSEIANSSSAKKGWMLPFKNSLKWSRDNERLFFGFKPATAEKAEIKLDSANIYNFDEILSNRGVDVWHWDDPLIKTNEKEELKKNKDKTFRSVYHLASNKIVVLADSTLPEVRFSNSKKFALGFSPVPYLKLRTWEGDFEDIYVVNLQTGERIKASEKIAERVSISPDGEFLVYYNNKNWYLFNSGSRKTICLTEKLETPFYDEDHDYPSDVPGYGVGGWTKDKNAVLIYDKFDIWKFETETGSSKNITSGAGRKNNLMFRVIKTNREAEYLPENLLLEAYHDKEKYTTFYSLKPGNAEPVKLAGINKNYAFKARAKEADKILFTRESYREFPDLWIADGIDFNNAGKVSNLGEQTEEFFWGNAELIEWSSADGTPLQGIVIKPGNYNPAKKYPVLVYYYRFFTPRLYNFPDVVVNHRPNYPVYNANDYVIFLPDIRFDIGYPGMSAVKCLVPGVQKLIDMGIADPKGIGLHGHSWSGYQTAFVVTQTNIFACAVAGAPVSNMTSAYSGIRWGTGLARQFQYEKSQSRIGGSLWEYPERYIQNSPVFFADRINTPLLIEHGDIDEAVPWYQSIEFYLAMRRLGKDCVFLQYRDEPHHLKKYPNKLDYSIKMMEYLDHYCKGKPAADWIKNGVPYSE